MKKSVVAFGVIVLLAGFMLMSLSNTATDVTNYNMKEQGPEYSSWSISQNFNQSEILGFDFRPHSDWSDDTYEFYYTNVSGELQPARYLEIKVTNPQSNYTTFRILLIITPNVGAQGVQIFPDYYEVYNSTLADWVRLYPAKGFTDQTGGILIEKGYPSIFDTKEGHHVFQLGKTSIQGVYDVSLTLDPETVHEPDSNKSRASPPVYLDIFETKIETHYPYSWLLPVGIPTSIVGVAITILGVKIKKDKPFQRA